jgi:dolichyl-phosphate beta-glucosyltransferase
MREQTMTSQPFLSLVIPSWNEQDHFPDTLQAVVSYLIKQEYTSEVIVVDDGSTDRTPDTVRSFIAQHTGEPTLRLIENDHRGKGYTVRTGMLVGLGKYILFADADLSTPVYEVGKMIGALESGADITIGTRVGIGSERLNEPMGRRVMRRSFNMLVRLVSGLHFQDTQAGIKGFRNTVARDLFSRVRLYGADAKQLRGRALTAFDVEVLYMAQKSGYRIEEIPVQWSYYTASKLSPLRDAARMFSDVVKVRWMAAKGMYENP